MSNLPIIIAGAGPVGLTLALLLDKHFQDQSANVERREIKIFESVNEIKPLGVGINLLPHSVRVLHALGLEEKLSQVGVRTSSLTYFNAYGQKIWSEPRGLDAGYPCPQYSIHRGKLQHLLYQEVIDRLGPDCISTGCALSHWRDTNDGVEVHLKQSNGAQINITGACLIAADGINSTARRTLYPDEGEALYGGRLLWRATSLAEPFLDGRSMFMAGYQDLKFVAYPISAPNPTDGKQLINWIAERSEPEWTLTSQDWNREVDISKFSADFDSWRFDWLDIPALMQACNNVYEFPLSDRDPLPQWTHGHMTLIGDAAHPMYPIGSNGASQGILDAEKLANEMLAQNYTFDYSDGYEQAFANYEAERRPATSKIVLLNRQNGPEQVMQLAHERAPNGFSEIESVIPHSELEAIAARYKQTAGFTVQGVNEAAGATAT